MLHRSAAADNEPPNVVLIYIDDLGYGDLGCYWSPNAVHSFNDEVPASLSDRTTATGRRRNLAGAIVSVDDQVGKLLDLLDKRGLRENTLVIFSSDNGAGTDGGSSTPYAGGKGPGTQKEGWVRVPTIFSMPGVLPEGTEYDGLIANFDSFRCPRWTR